MQAYRPWTSEGFSKEPFDDSRMKRPAPGKGLQVVWPCGNVSRVDALAGWHAR